MQSVNEWFVEYGKSHTNATNKRIHWICVPAIYWSVYAMLASIPTPTFFPVWMNWGLVMMVAAQVYYLILSWRLAVGLLLFNVLVVGLTYVIATLIPVPLWIVALSVFIVAWIGQFIGHKIEGKKPSFFKDVQFLMIGPAWLMGFIYRKLNLAY